MESWSPKSTSSDDTMENEEASKNNSMIDQILKMKQQRLKILHDFKKEYENEMVEVVKDVQENKKKKETVSKLKRKQDVPAPVPVRRSQRINSKIEEDSPPVLYDTSKIFVERPPNDYGPMPGIEVGHEWDTRMDCSYDGVHRPTVAGIHAGPLGAYSIALSGGYPEDIDEGYTFTYTGAGGRDLKGTAMKPKNLRTAPQTKDQELEGVNYSLVKSIETGKPVRVIRGYKSDSIYAPESGYRYDGLYKVVKYWEDYGKTGFRIYRFKMVRLENQARPPWEQPTKRLRKYKSVRNENLNPNIIDSDDNSSYVQELAEKHCNDPSSIDNKNESELDVEIQHCNEKLCRNSIHSPNIYENLKNSTETSFIGWD